jgi:UDP-N-acetylmuramate--alanine ligase
MTVSDFFNYMKPGMKGHLVGIGGVSMSALAETLKAAGLEIRGSDERDGAVADRLRDKGIPVYLGHSAENVKGADFVVRTAAAKDSNPEVAAARELGIPVFERTQAWGAIMMKYKNAVCVAGTHGKTTTTSMVTHILMAAGRDPTVMIGGYLPLIGSAAAPGRGRT